MSYQDTIDYLYNRLPMFSRIGAAAMKNDLHNTIAICSYLGNPEKKIKTIHVAGTNGKGSTSHMLAALLQKAGYKTGLYTSPHLYDFRERIKINGEMCSEEFVTEFTEKVKPLIETVNPSFFEITVGMAFDYFAKEAVDIAVIETGLGGRLDSTNVIQPILSIITNIGWDHMNLLGNTLSAIAFEKAGIIKKNTPVVIGETIPDSLAVFKNKAAIENAPLYFAETQFELINFQHYWEYSIFKYQAGIEVKSDLPGIYQAKNIKTVLTALKILKTLGWEVNNLDALSEVKKLTGLMGRWECIQDKPRIVLDVAHNEHGMKVLIEQLQLIQYRQLHIITGMVKDKDPNAILELLPRDAHYYFTQSQNPRALPNHELARFASAHGLKGQISDHVNSALSLAKGHANEDDLIIVIGSIYLVAEINRN